MPQQVQVDRLGIAEFPDGMPPEMMAAHIVNHLGSLPNPSPSPAPSRQPLLGPPGNRLESSSVAGQMGDVGYAAMKALGINPFGHDDPAGYFTSDTGPGTVPRFQTGEMKAAVVPFTPNGFITKTGEAIDIGRMMHADWLERQGVDAGKTLDDFRGALRSQQLIRAAKSGDDLVLHIMHAPTGSQLKAIRSIIDDTPAMQRIFYDVEHGAPSMWRSGSTEPDRFVKLLRGLGF